jgi:hypothetical protein
MIDPTLVWGAVLAFAAIGAAVVRAAARGNTGTAADYYLGGRRLGGMVSGPSYAATTYSAFMLVVLTGLATCRNQIPPVPKGLRLRHRSRRTNVLTIGHMAAWKNDSRR